MAGLDSTKKARKHIEIQSVGGGRFQEYWIPAGKLAEFNCNIVGAMGVIATFPDFDGKQIR
jgi:hypothetical protein